MKKLMSVYPIIHKYILKFCDCGHASSSGYKRWFLILTCVQETAALSSLSVWARSRRTEPDLAEGSGVSALMLHGGQLPVYRKPPGKQKNTCKKPQGAIVFIVQTKYQISVWTSSGTIFVMEQKFILFH